MMKRIDLGTTRVSLVTTKGMKQGEVEVMTWAEDDRVDVNITADDITNTVSMTKLQAHVFSMLLGLAAEEP